MSMSDKILRAKLAYFNPELRDDLLPLINGEPKTAADDPAEIASDLIEDTVTVSNWHKDLLREFKRAQRDLKGLKRVGVGDTESLNLLRSIILPAVKKQRDNYDAAVDQIEDLLRRR